VARMTGAATDALGGVDVLVNNAGVARRDAFLAIAPADWDRIIAVNLRGMFLVAQAVARQMVARGGGGVIINMCSTNGIAGEGEYTHYNASKAGVLLLTKTMAVELGRHQIRVNALCPGHIRTPLNEAIAAQIGGEVRGELRAGPDPAGAGRPSRGCGCRLRLSRLRRRCLHPRQRAGHRRRPARRDVTRGHGNSPGGRCPARRTYGWRRRRGSRRRRRGSPATCRRWCRGGRHPG